MSWVAGELCNFAGDERAPAFGEGKDAADWTTRRASLAETVTHSRRSSAGVFDLVDLTGVPLDSCFRWSPVQSAESLDDNTTSAAPTAPSSAPRDVAAATPGTTSHAAVLDGMEAWLKVPSSQDVELQTLGDKLQALPNTRRAVHAARAPPPHTADEPAQPEHRTPNAMSDAEISSGTPSAMSDAEISEAPARLWYEPSIRAWCPVQRDAPNTLRIAMATSPVTPTPAFDLESLIVGRVGALDRGAFASRVTGKKALPGEMQGPGLMLPAVVPATLPHLSCRQAGRQAPGRSRVRCMAVL